MSGINSVVLEDAVIESNSIAAAGPVVTKGAVAEPGSVYAGVPARKTKTIDKELPEGDINRIANAYQLYAGWYKE